MVVRHLRRSLPILLVAGLALALSASFTACDGGAEEPPPPAAASPTATPTPEPTPPPTPTTTPLATPSITATPDQTATPAATATPSPTPTPARTATPSPSPTATVPAPTPSPTPTPALNPCAGFECVERAPGAFEHRTWEAGEGIDWTEGAFALETLTGRVHGHRLVPPYTEEPWNEAPQDYRVLSRRWVGARITDQPAHLPGYPAKYGTQYLLLDRETLQAWRWPVRALNLAALSDDHVLFQDRSDGSFTLMTREGEVATQVSLPGVEEYSDQYSFFSPDGRTLVISVRVGPPDGGERVYRMPVTASRPEPLFEPKLPDGCRVSQVRANYSGTWPAYGQKGSRSLGSLGWARSRDPQPRVILVDLNYCPESDENGAEWLLFNWEGDALPIDAGTGYRGSILGGPIEGQDANAELPATAAPLPTVATSPGKRAFRTGSSGTVSTRRTDPGARSSSPTPRRASRSCACSRPTHTSRSGKPSGSRTAKASWSACSAATRSFVCAPSPKSSGSRRFRPVLQGATGLSQPPPATAATSRTGSPACTTPHEIVGYLRASRCPPTTPRMPFWRRSRTGTRSCGVKPTTNCATGQGSGTEECSKMDGSEVPSTGRSSSPGLSCRPSRANSVSWSRARKAAWISASSPARKPSRSTA